MGEMISKMYTRPTHHHLNTSSLPPSQKMVGVGGEVLAKFLLLMRKNILLLGRQVGFLSSQVSLV